MIEKRITTLTVEVESLQPLLDLERYSSLDKIIRIFGWIRRFITNVCIGSQNRSSEWELDSEEISQAKLSFLKVLQRKNYSEEIENLQKGISVNRKSSLLQLDPILGEDGLLRVGGRLQYAALGYDDQHPIILPKCHVATLIVRKYHVLLKHAGVNTMVSAIRGMYWIIGLRVLAKRVFRGCFSCQIQEARACDQITAPLPEDCVVRTPVFATVGIDFAGPVYCSDTGVQKHYILLFTCAVVRAVHLELTSSLSLEHFVLAFRRFVARRGLPTTIYSDNAPTFHGGSKLLQKHFGDVAPKWKYITPLAPFHGGFYERLIRCVKTALRRSLGKKSVPRMELETSLCEVEACINSRPLTYVDNSREPLTPSHFLIDRGTHLLPTQNEVSESSSSDLVRMDALRQEILERFWEIWSQEYLKSLPPARKGKKKGNLKVGSIVLIREEHKPRLQWLLGRVTKVFQGKDGQVRTVELKTSKGKILRAVQLLHQLEMLDPEETVDSPSVITEPNIVSSVSDSEELVTRSGRRIKRK